MVYKVDRLENEGKFKIKVKFSKEEFDKALAKQENENQQEKLNKAVNELISKSYPKVVELEKLQVAGYPSISLSDDIDENFPFAYEAEVDAYPTLKLGLYKGLNIKKDKVVVTDQDVEMAINETLKQQSDLVVVEGPLKEGQTAVIDFVGKLNGVAFDGGTGKSYPLEIGSHAFVPGFEEQLVGMNINETRNINITFPENYTAELAGKDVVFEVTLNEIKEKVLPELTDKFVKQLAYENVNTVSEYKQYIKNQLTQYKEMDAKNKAAVEVYKALKEHNPVRIPKYFVDEYIENQVQRVKAQAEQYQMPVETLLQFSGFESIEAFKNAYQEVAKNHIHEQIIMREIIMKENFNVTKEEVEAYYETLAKQNNMELEAFKQRYNDTQVVESLLMKKCAKFIIEKNIIE